MSIESTPTSQATAADGRASRQKTAFRLEYAVANHINAPQSRVWKLLTTAAEFPRWTSTIDKLGGTIAEGEKLELRAAIAPDRTFKPKVATLVPETTMVWSDGMAPMFKGVRTFTLSPRADGTDFAMREVFSGLMLPMIARSLPDFTASFEQFAADLKRAAESA